jgi:hypothetical protein
VGRTIYYSPFTTYDFPLCGCVRTEAERAPTPQPSRPTCFRSRHDRNDDSAEIGYTTYSKAEAVGATLRRLFSCQQLGINAQAQAPSGEERCQLQITLDFSGSAAILITERTSEKDSPKHPT